MSLIGTYKNEDSGATLNITASNNANGEGKGEFVMVYQLQFIITFLQVA